MLPRTASLRHALPPIAGLAPARGRWASALACLVLLIGLPPAHASAQTRSITVAWDAGSSDTAGYIVYLGSVPGSYDSAIDVRRQTSYTVQGIEVGQAVYISVAAYSASGAVGPRTPEIFFDGRVQAEPSPPGGSTTGSLPCLAGRASCPRPAATTQASTGSLTASLAPCVAGPASDCTSTDLVYEGEGIVVGLLPLDSGDLLLAERSGRVLLVGPDLSRRARVLLDPADSGTLVHAFVPAPDVATTGDVYLLSSQAARRGTRTLQLTRMRLLAGALTARSPIFELDVREGTRPTLAVDAGGRLYLGLPDVAGGPLAGAVVRLDPGTETPSHTAAGQAYLREAGNGLGLAVGPDGQVVSLQGTPGGWVLRQQDPQSGAALTYGPFSGDVTGMSGVPGHGEPLLLISASDRSVTEVALAQGALTIVGRLTLEEPIQAAAGQSRDGLWVATTVEARPDLYRVVRIRKPQ